MRQNTPNVQKQTETNFKNLNHRKISTNDKIKRNIRQKNKNKKNKTKNNTGTDNLINPNTSDQDK